MFYSSQLALNLVKFINIAVFVINLRKVDDNFMSFCDSYRLTNYYSSVSKTAETNPSRRIPRPEVPRL